VCGPRPIPGNATTFEVIQINVHFTDGVRRSSYGALSDLDH